MNARLILFSLLASIAFILTGCDKNDDDNEGVIPLPSVNKAFNEKYPDAKDAFFDIDGSYYVVDFKNGSVPTTAWFTGQGVWTMDKAEVPFQQLPAEVLASFYASSYAQWTVGDAYVINHVEMAVIYKIEVESGESEVGLYYSENGDLIEAVNDNGSDDSPTNIPKDVTDL